MLVSVIIACYNHGSFVERCLSSVCDQTYSEIELIVIDDRSTDQSEYLIRKCLSSPEFQKRFSRLLFLQNRVNSGAAFSWNRAINHASSNILFLLNSDDCFTRDRVRKFVEVVDPQVPSFALSSVDVISEGDSCAYTYDAMQLIGKAERDITAAPYLSWAMLQSQVGISSGNFVFTKKLWDSVGYFKNLRYCHDWDFALRSVTVCEPLYLRDPLYQYRIHGSNSFLSLSNVAEQETRRCIGDYMQLVHVRAPQNTMCLCPANFGAGFDKLMEELPSFSFWWGKVYQPYRPEHRTVHYKSVSR